MLISRRILLTTLTSILLCNSIIGHAVPTKTYDRLLANEPRNNINKTFFNIGFLYIQPSSNNLKYAAFVSGTQPYYQSWHYQEITPNYHPAFELAFNYAIPRTLYSAAINWTRLNSNDSSSKQASTNTDLSTVEFVGPPYEMSPPVFGIKSVNSTVNFDFNNVLLNVGKLAELGDRSQIRFFGGIDIFSLNQTITTTFGNYAGSAPTAYSYPLPPDPSFSFQTQNTSKYLGAGPALGMSFQFKTESGFGLMGDVLGLLTAGTIQTQDNFTSTSARLTSLGIGTSHQQITSPNASQIILGADGKLGVFYNYQGTQFPNFTIEAGYRIATFLNAISTISPGTLVQPGTVLVTPEFSTGTMAIVSTEAKTGPFSFGGAFLNLKIALG
jgi:hypothetical protein